MSADMDVVYTRECDKTHEGLNTRLDEHMEYLVRIEAKLDKNGNRTMLKLVFFNLAFLGVVVGTVVGVVKALV